MSESQANQPPVKPAEKPKLIIDTNAFIKCLDLNKLSQSYEIYTSDMALYEIKDKKAKEKFAHLLFEVKTKYPSKTASSFGIYIRLLCFVDFHNFIIFLKKLHLCSIFIEIHVFTINSCLQTFYLIYFH